MVHVDVIIALKQGNEEQQRELTGRQTSSFSNLSIFIMLSPKHSNTLWNNDDQYEQSKQGNTALFTLPLS